MFKHSRLGRIAYAHFERVMLSIAVALPQMAYFTWLLQNEVEEHDVSPQWAPLLNWAPNTLLAFALNRWLPWKDRDTPTKTALWRWMAVSIGHSLISYGIYSLLRGEAGWNYLEVSVLLALTLGPVSYILRNIWIFARRQIDQKA